MQLLTEEQIKDLSDRGGSAAAARYNQLAHKISNGTSTALDRQQAKKLKQSIEKLIGKVDNQVMRLTQLKKEGKSVTFKSPVIEGDVVAIVPTDKERNQYDAKDSDLDPDVVFTVDEMLWIMRQPDDEKREILRGVHKLMKAFDGEMILT